jgi:hypothetical protein
MHNIVSLHSFAEKRLLCIFVMRCSRERLQQCFQRCLTVEVQLLQFIIHILSPVQKGTTMLNIRKALKEFAVYLGVEF